MEVCIDGISSRITALVGRRNFAGNLERKDWKWRILVRISQEMVALVKANAAWKL